MKYLELEVAGRVSQISASESKYQSLQKELNDYKKVGTKEVIDTLKILKMTMLS